MNAWPSCTYFSAWVRSNRSGTQKRDCGLLYRARPVHEPSMRSKRARARPSTTRSTSGLYAGMPASTVSRHHLALGLPRCPGLDRANQQDVARPLVLAAQFADVVAQLVRRAAADLPG